MTEELKPCPFCGSGAVTFHDAEDGGWGVICTNQKCECTLDRYAIRESAETAWNNRATPAWTDEQIVALLASLGIDADKSKYGFPELQVHTTVPGVREILKKAQLAAHN